MERKHKFIKNFGRKVAPHQMTEHVTARMLTHAIEVLCDSGSVPARFCTFVFFFTIVVCILFYFLSSFVCMIVFNFGGCNNFETSVGSFIPATSVLKKKLLAGGPWDKMLAFKTFLNQHLLNLISINIIILILRRQSLQLSTCPN